MYIGTRAVLQKPEGGEGIMKQTSEGKKNRDPTTSAGRRAPVICVFLALLILLNVPPYGWADEDTQAWSAKGSDDFVAVVEGANQYGPENPDYGEVLLQSIGACASVGEVITAAIMSAYASMVFEDMAAVCDGAARETYQEKAEIYRGFSLTAFRASDSKDVIEKSMRLLEAAYQASPTRLLHMPPELRVRLHGARLHAGNPIGHAR